MTLGIIIAAIGSVAMLYASWGFLKEIWSPSDDSARTPIGRMGAAAGFLFAFAGITYLWVVRANVLPWLPPVLGGIVLLAFAIALIQLLLMVRAGKAKEDSAR